MMSVFVLSMLSVLMPSMLFTGPVLPVFLLAFLSLEQLPIFSYFLHVLLFAILRTARTARLDIRLGLCLGTFVDVRRFYIRNIRTRGKAVVASCHIPRC